MASRIRFRELRIDDVKRLYEIYSDKEAMRFRGSKPMEVKEDAYEFVKNQKTLKEDEQTIRKGIELKKGAELIGSIMIRFWNTNKTECEIGYSIGYQYWGRGLGKETLNLLLKDLKQNREVTNIIAWSNKENIPSIKILENSGFRRIEGKESMNNYFYQRTNGGD